MKRLLSILLALCLAAGLLCIAAMPACAADVGPEEIFFAADETDEEPPQEPSTWETIKYILEEISAFLAILTGLLTPLITLLNLGWAIFRLILLVLQIAIAIFSIVMLFK